MIERDDEGDIPFEYRAGILESLWHSFATFFMVGDKEVKTIPARIIQISYWFMAFVIIAVYTADLTVRLSEPLVSYEISDY